MREAILAYVANATPRELKILYWFIRGMKKD